MTIHMRNIVLIVCTLIYGVSHAATSKSAPQPHTLKKQPELQKTIEKPPTAITVTASGVNTVVLFPTSKDVKAAAYMKGEKLWVIFDKPMQLQIPKLDNNKPTVDRQNDQQPIFTKRNPEVIAINAQNCPDNTACYTVEVERKEGRPLMTYMLHDQDGWGITFTSEFSVQNSSNMREVKVTAKPYAMPTPSVELGIGNLFNPIKVKDKDTGQYQIFLPLLEDRIGVGDEYNFVDFTIKRSIQGVVIESHNDKLQIENKGIEAHIYSTSGLNLAPKVYSAAPANTQSLEPRKLDDPLTYEHQILQLKAFTVPDGQFYSTLKKWQRQRYKVEHDTKETHLSLALFYMASGMYKEAVTTITELEKSDDEYSKYYDVALLKAIACLFSNDEDEAYEAINKLNVADVPVHLRREVRMWYSIIEYYDEMGDNITIGTNMIQLLSDHNSNFLAGYNNDMLAKIALIVFENRIQNKDWAGAKLVNEVLNEIKPAMSARQKNEFLYELGQYYEQQDNINNAKEAWEQCASDIDDTLNRARCRFEKARMLYKTSQFINNEYIDELQKIAVTWRGDGIEREMMKELGDLYTMQGDTLNALRSWRVITDYHTNTSDALLLAQKMSDTFVEFFLSDAGKSATPFQAVSLFYEFQNLVPLGDIGDELIVKLTSDLVELDLVNRAAVLMNHLVDNRLKGMRREEIINRLSKAYLIASLPFNSIEVIAKGLDYEELPEHIAKERRYIHARALMKMGETEAVERLLDKDINQQADDIRADLYWQGGNWQKFSQNSEPYLYAIRANKSDLDDGQVLRVLQQAVAYMMMGQDELLRGLYNDFYPRIPEENRYGKIMALLANLWQVRAPMDGKQNIDELRALVNALRADLR
ncbi:MAG: hypothetical protein JSS50_00675 [Proteobacteria bacterium]|nr:hypothetical protein [Pseudomonadota bacterium]